MDRAPLTTLLAARALTGALVDLPAANRIRVGGAARLALWFTYTRGGASATGSLIIRVEGAAVAPSVNPATVTTWAAFPALDLGSFAAGRMNAYPLEVRFLPTLAGPTEYRLGDLDVLDLTLVRILVGDSDGVAPGVVDVAYRLVVL